MNPEVYIRAAKIIDEQGWWGGPGKGIVTSQCPITALHIALDHLRIDDGRSEIMQALYKQAGAEDCNEFFSLNDSQPAHTGKQWAITVLRETAKTVSAALRRP